MSKNLKIFIILPTWLGDAVMSSAALKLIFTHFKSLDKNAQFFLYGSFAACELFKECENTQVFEAFKKRRFISFFKLARAFKKDFNFDYAFSFRSAMSSKIMLFMLASRAKFVFKKHAFKELHQVLKYLFFVKNALNLSSNENLQSHFFKKEPLSENFKNVSVEKIEFNQAFLSLNEKLKNEILNENSLFLPFKFHKNSLDELLKEHKKSEFCFKELKFLGINAGAHYGLAKRWPPQYFATVANAFSSTHQILIFGVKSESEICSEIENLLLKKCIKAINLCAKTSIKELCEYISALDLLLTNDSGTMHIAAVYKIKSVVLFGPTNFKQTSPWNNQNARLLHLNLSCMPCMKRICPLKTHECMLNLKPEFVINAAKELLKEK